MVAVGIASFAVIVALSVIGYFVWARKKRSEAQEKIKQLNIARDTARMVEEYQRDQIERSWIEYDKSQWDERFEK